MIIVNLYYSGKNKTAKKFVEEMYSSHLIDQIRDEKGNISYEYFFSKDNEDVVLLVDKWINQEALDQHHQSDVMVKIAELRKKYQLKLKVEKYEVNEYEKTNSGKRYSR